MATYLKLVVRFCPEMKIELSEVQLIANNTDIFSVGENKKYFVGFIELLTLIKTGYGIQISDLERSPEAQSRACGGDEGNFQP